MTEKEIKELKEHNKRLKEIIDEKNEQQSQQETSKSVYHGIRFIQLVCIGFAVFGALWKGTEIFNLDTPSFLMLYGVIGAGISEVVARVFKKKTTK